MKIGCFLFIKFSSQQNINGLIARIYDETKNTFLVEKIGFFKESFFKTKKKNICIQKNAGIFSFSKREETLDCFLEKISFGKLNYINGLCLLKRPYLVG